MSHTEIILNSQAQSRHPHLKRVKFVCFYILQALMKCKEDVMEKFGLRSDQVEISMGMSNDFQQAVSINLYSLIFRSSQSACFTLF